MAGFGEAARGSDRATKILKFNGLPGKGEPIVEEFKKPQEVPVLGQFISTMGDAVSLNPLSAANAFGDSVQKPRFIAKITLFDEHSDDNF